MVRVGTLERTCNLRVLGGRALLRFSIAVAGKARRKIDTLFTFLFLSDFS